MRPQRIRTLAIATSLDSHDELLDLARLRPVFVASTLQTNVSRLHGSSHATSAHKGIIKGANKVVGKLTTKLSAVARTRYRNITSLIYCLPESIRVSGTLLPRPPEAAFLYPEARCTPSRD